MRRFLGEGTTVLAADIRADALARLTESLPSTALIAEQVGMMDLNAVETLIATGARRRGGIGRLRLCRL
ncbi:hypothetical protein [Sphingobium sp.]|uniref:hypothetical protein n=1 Tax=Sphingobium sp. TaxID=1912891 RepID=UPI002C2BCA11|nr:hypothetical protein [Sphingobium sp.]HUD94528.1 hypothetical protein [Sphingobium sp.]